MNHALIIDRETSSIDLLKKTVEAINIIPTVFLSWNATVNMIPLDEVKAVFLNIELPRLDIKKVMTYFNEYEGQNGFKIPVFFLLSTKNDEAIKKLSKISNAGILTKPFKIEEIFYLLDKTFDLAGISIENFDYNHNLNKFKKYSEEIAAWLDTFKALINK